MFLSWLIIHMAWLKWTLLNVLVFTPWFIHCRTRDQIHVKQQRAQVQTQQDREEDEHGRSLLRASSIFHVSHRSPGYSTGTHYTLSTKCMTLTHKLQTHTLCTQWGCTQVPQLTLHGTVCTWWDAVNTLLHYMHVTVFWRCTLFKHYYCFYQSNSSFGT